MRIQANKGRRLQAARTNGRKLFGRERREIFLQWLAATANVSFAAAQAGVCRQTVSKHRLADPDFEYAYRQAIELAVPDLQARLHAHLKGQPKLDIHGELEPPDETGFDPQLALQMLREHQRMLRDMRPGHALKHGRPPEKATMEEACRVLAKRLKAFKH
jgi:hypothetical protein